MKVQSTVACGFTPSGAPLLQAGMNTLDDTKLHQGDRDFIAALEREGIAKVVPESGTKLVEATGRPSVSLDDDFGEIPATEPAPVLRAVPKTAAQTVAEIRAKRKAQ